MNILRCPVCKNEILSDGKTYRCTNGHCFDIAKEGYLNLLTGSKAGSLIGDNRDMAKSRRSFLEKGYFEPLANTLCDAIAAEQPKAVLDICCGEGYYTSHLAEKSNAEFYGFDISKEMVRLAGKRKSKATFFVANMSDIPVGDCSFSLALHLFAPVCADEFARVLAKGGCLLSVTPGAKHLWEMKQKLYDTPYENEENAPEIKGLSLESTKKISAEIFLDNAEDIDALFRMTPYYYHTNAEDKAKLAALVSLTTQIEFLLGIYRKC